MEKRIWPPDSNARRQQPSGQPPRSLRDRIIYALRQIHDPEIPINIYDLGLIYKIDINDETGDVRIEMTLTTPNCPEAETIPGHVRKAIAVLPDVGEVEVDLVWSPPWDKNRMSDDAKLILGID